MSINVTEQKTDAQLSNEQKESIVLNAKIVVNADDYGASHSLNRAILDSFNLGTISTTTLMCNMPGFEEAVQLAYENKITDRIGIHLNVSENRPLSKKIQTLPKFVNENGLMFKSYKGQFLTKEEKDAVYEELQAQVDRFKSSGFFPSHIDTHHHFHFSIDSNKIVRELAKRNNIKAVRLRFNYCPMPIRARLFSKFLNNGIKSDGLATTDYFCEIRMVDSKLLASNKAVEVMVHPVYNEKNIILNYENGLVYEDLVKKHLPVRDFVTYDFLNKRG